MLRRSLAVLLGWVLLLGLPAWGAFPLTVTDALGRTVTIRREPARIISLAPSITEILFALGLDARIVGVSSADDYPPEKVRAKPKVGGVQLDLERIVVLHPDLILGIPSLQGGQLRLLIDMKLPVVAVDAASLEQVYAQIETIGTLTGHLETARHLVQGIRTRERTVAAAVRGLPLKRVYVEVWGEPLIAAGGGTFVDDLISRAGGKNIFADLRGWPQVSGESVIRRDPEVILLTHPQRDRVLTRRGWAQVTALRERKVAEVDGALVSRPGPRIVEGLAQIARIIHPEAFR